MGLRCPRQYADVHDPRGTTRSPAEAWFSPLTPGPTGYRPFSADRNYVFPWGNAWFTSDCSANNLVPGMGYDISAAITNLFVMHNRMHDWSYHLGFTEQNWNRRSPTSAHVAAARTTPVLGNAQAGAVNGGFPSYLGRDNANMISLPDGVPADHQHVPLAADRRRLLFAVRRR